MVATDNKEYHLTFTHNDLCIIIELTSKLAAGDEISLTGGSNNKICFTDSESRSTSDYATTSNSFVIPENHNLVGKQTLYIWRNSGNTYIKTLTITRTSSGGGGGGDKDYTVTAATSTGDNSLGTVVAGASSLDATETTTITATPATGYQVTHWEVSGTDASISPSGASNATSTTLTMGTADATVTVTFGPKSYTITLDNQSATEAGTENVTATYNANSNLTSSITCPTKTDKVFAGYFTAANGGGVQLIDAAGNWIASAGGGSTYLDGSKNWKKDGDLTLYACWMEYCPGMDMAAQAISLGSGEHKTWTGLTTNKILYSVAGNTTFDDSSDASDAYDGLKFKNSGDYLLFLVQANSSLKLYFGYTDTKPKISINGGAESDINVASTKSKTPNQDVDFGTETYDRLVKVRTVTSNAVVLQKIEMIAPASSDCEAYEFHYGPEIGEWETACFTQVGETDEWRITDFAIPSTPNYYVGHHADGGWNDGWSATKSWTDTYSDGNGAMVLLPGTSAVGQATGATGTLIIWSNSGDKNKYVGFKPDGYGISYGGNSYAFAAMETANEWETGVVTLPDVSTEYTMGLATATEGTYVACAHSADAEAISNMGVTNVGNGKKKIYLVPGSFDVGNVEEKYAVYDVTNNAFDTDFMTDSDGDGVYEGYVGSTCTSIVLCRMSDVATVADLESKNWDGARWNQTGNIAISGTLAMKYTITSLNGNECAYSEENVHPATGQKGVFRMWDNSGSQNWYVSFVPYYTLSYDGNGGTGSMDGTQRSSESSTLTVTVAANGFTAPAGRAFAGWAISQEHADAGTVDYAAGADFTLNSDATLYAVWESNCPTTGTVFTLSNVGSGYSNESGAETELTNITLSGGTAYGLGTSGKALEYKSNKIKYGGGTNYIKLVLDCPLQAGDEISVTCDAGTGLNFNTDPSTGLGGEDSHPTYVLNGGTYEVKAEDGIIGESTIVCWRRTGNGTNVTSITITRPAKYAVSYASAKGEAPEGGTVSSVTLAEITGVAGWKNTGWKADVATEVSGASIDANTLIENGTKVTLTAATTFTAQWAELYTITTGSPANGTVEADKASAVAGATITLAATPASGYKLSAWDVYKTGDASTKVSVTNNQFEMPAYGVTISAEFVESVVLYDYAVMAAAENKSFTDETVSEDKTGKSKTFGSEGNPQLVVENAGWDSKGNIINSFIKFFGGTSSMSVVVPAGRKATVTIKYGSYNTGRYLLVNGTEQTHPLKALDNDITTSNIDTYMPTVELTNQTGTLVLTANGSNNIYIAYVDVTLTGNASYGITYNLNEGAWDGDAGAASYTYGTGIATLASNVTKAGYDFAGWFGNEGLTGDAITTIATSATGDKELWAAWTPKSYTLTWNWDGGSCSATAGDDYTAGGSVAYGTTLVYPEASTMSKADAAFAGWSSTPATMPAEALTITAQWAPEHAISYKEVKGSDVSAYPTTYVQGVGVASFEPLADVADFHFTGWSPASIGTDATEDVDVTAQWVAAYNVSFSAGEGSGTVPATFQKWSGATFELPGQGEMVAPAGKVFIGWKANGAGETRAEGYEYTMTAAAVEFEAQWKAVTLLINYDGENYSLNTMDFQTGVDLVDGVAGYEKQAKFGNTANAVTGIDNINKAIIYHTKTNATKVTITAYNNYSSNSTSNFYYSVVTEGVTSTPSVTTKTLDKNTGDSYEINMTGRSTLYIMTGQKELRICQVEIEENGTANKVAPEVGYSVNLNKQRPYLATTATTFEGITYRGATSYKPVNGQVQISTCGTDYYSFTIPAGQTRQLQLTTSNTNKYVVSQTLGDNTESKKVSGNKTFNLTAGTWYINPQGSNVNITTIAFDETPDPITVAFNSNGGSEVASQALFAGDKVTAPTAPTKSGYRFVEWQKSGAAYDFTTALVAGDAPGFTLDAVWQKVWTVTFNSDGGSDVDPQVVDDGGVATLPDPAPTKAGHTLVRWYKVTGEEGQEETDYNFSTAVAADMTLKVLWHELQNDPSLGSLSYDGNAIELSSGVESEGVITYTYELPYNVNYTAGKLVPVPAAGTATLSDITYTSGTKTASFTVTTADGPVEQNYAVVFTNAPKDLLCLVWAEMTDDNTLTLDESKSYLDIEVKAAGGVREEDTPIEYEGYTGYKFRSNGSYTELKDGNFKSGDKVDVFVVNAIGDKMRIYDANEAINDNIVAISENNMVQGHNLVTLTADAASLYLRRGADPETYKGWNPHIAYIAVYRAYPVPVVKTITFNGAEGVVGESTITATIPYTTNMESLPIEATFMSNDPANTSGDVGGSWVDNDGVYTNSYVVTDKDGDTKTYTVTLTRAAVSHDASLTALAVEGYEISFAPATLSYDVELPYGAVIGDLPAVSYTAAAGATAVKTDAAEMPGYTTITVTAEDGETAQAYSIYFHANQIPSLVIYDGTTDMNFVAESNSQLVTWTSVGTDGTKQNGAVTINGKNYAHNIKVFGSSTSASRNMDIVIPANYMAKFYLAASSNSGSSADIYITKDAVGAMEGAIVSVSGDVSHPTWSESDYVAAGHYFLNATNSTRLYELSVTLYSIDYTRSVTSGRLGTICLEHGGTMRGAAVYEVAYFNPDNKKIYFDEVISGEMEPGMPYVFLPDEGNNDQLVVMYGNNVPAAVAGHHNGLYGSFTEELLAQNGENYIFSSNLYWLVNSAEVYVGQNRAYLKVAEIYGYHNEPIPPVPHGRRRITMDAGAQAPNTATGVEDVQGDKIPCTKVLIDNKIYILRGEKMYDATGRLVK